MATVSLSTTDAAEAAIAYLVAQLHNADPDSTVTVDDYRQARLDESLERCVQQARDHVTAQSVAAVTALSPDQQAAIIKQTTGVTVDPALLAQSA